MTSPAKDIAELLETNGVGTVGTNIFVGHLPLELSNIVGLFDTGGIYVNPKWKRDEFTLQILIRGPKEDYEGGYAKAKAVKDAILGIDTVTINSTDYLQFIIIGDITFLSFDDKKRPQFTTNWRIVRENQPGGVRSDF